MSHFVKLVRDVPDPDKDAISALYIPKGGNAKVGLWGCYDVGTRQDVVVKVVKGPGTATAKGKRGADVMAYDLMGVTGESIIQAFMSTDGRAWTLPMPMVRADSEDKAKLNAALLHSGNVMEAAILPSGRAVEYLPLEGGFGGPLKSVNGLAVHITAGRGTARSCFDTFTKRKVSTHFVIDRSGSIVQFVAASLTAYAQGPGNPHWLSVELVGSQSASNMSVTENIAVPQLMALQDLWKWVLVTFKHVKPTLAIPYTGQKHKVVWEGNTSHVQKDAAGNAVFGGILGYGLDQHYKQLAETFVSQGLAPASSDALRVCIDSSGLSCHWWLDYFPKSCPGAPIMAQMPEVLGKSAVALEGAEKYQVGPEG